ncbi:MAG: hypothetical protein RSC87_10160, partial [Muribaculaceae bacterium]
MKKMTYALMVLFLVLTSCEKEGEGNVEYVDLGLSVKWASCNEGASSPEGDGNYYTWKEAKSFSLPTQAQFKELKDNCTWKKSTKKGVKGMKVTGPNGNRIFIPFAGGSLNYHLISAQGTNGYYWSSTLRPEQKLSRY